MHEAVFLLRNHRCRQIPQTIASRCSALPFNTDKANRFMVWGPREFRSQESKPVSLPEPPASLPEPFGLQRSCARWTGFFLDQIFDFRKSSIDALARALNAAFSSSMVIASPRIGIHSLTRPQSPVLCPVPGSPRRTGLPLRHVSPQQIAGCQPRVEARPGSLQARG